MIILTIRTDKPDAEVGLYDNEEQLAYITWQAHRELGQTIHQKIHELLHDQVRDWPDVEGIVAYQGPGSFTGLRIGLTVANALAYANHLPIVAVMNGAETDDWQQTGITRLLHGETDKLALPEYGAEAHITQPKK